MKPYLSILLIMMVAAIGVGAEETEIRVPSAKITLLEGTPPHIDGILNDACWEKATILENFIIPHPGQGTPPQNPTRVYLLRDQHALYIGAKCFEKEMKSVSLADWFEIFISDPTLSVYYHFFLHPSNKLDQDGSGFTLRKPHWYGKVATHFQDHWEVEIVIPFTNFDPKFMDADEWRFNVCREKVSSPVENSEWSNTEGYFHVPSKFGRLLGMKGVDFNSPVEIPKESAGDAEKRTPAYMLLDRSYYTTEKTAQILIHLAPATLQKIGKEATLEVSLKDLQGKEVRQNTRPVAVTADIFDEFDIASLPLGNYAVDSILKGKESGRDQEGLRFSRVLKKLLPARNEVKVNCFTRLILVDGKPFFPIMSDIYFYGKKVADAPEDGLKRLVEESGFNALCPWAVYGEESVAACKKAGIKVILTTPNPIAGKTGKEMTRALSEEVKKYKDYSNLIGWLISDEGGIYGTEEEFKERYRRLKEIDPYHLVFRNDGGWIIGYGGPGGLESDDLYCGDYGGGDLVDQINCDAIPQGKPSMVLQGLWGVPEHIRYPTTAETTEWFYEILIHGATGAFWWGAHDAHPPVPGFWENVRKLRNEVEFLMPSLNAMAPAHHTTRDNEKVHFVIRKSPKGCYLIAVNTADMKQKAVFKLDPKLLAANGTAQRVFEKGAVPYKNSEITLEFAPLERQVYEISTNSAE